MILTLTLGLILALPNIFAFSWPASISIASQHALQQARDSHDPWAQLKSQGISPGEIDALFLQTREAASIPGIVMRCADASTTAEALSAYTQKPDDCFQRTAGRVRGLCADLNAGMHEARRVRAAISMTICELATASQPPPLECTPFAPPYAEHDSEAEHEHLQPPCVAALSRSPQSWSSYSGYLREIPQLCYAFRRWNDIDTARHIYANITREKIALLQYMREREERVGDMVDNLTTAQSSALHKFSVQTRDEMAHARGEWMRVVEEAVDGVIKVAVAKHNQTVDALVPVMSTTLSTHLADVLSQHAEVFDFGLRVREQWSDLASNFASMHDSIAGLSATSNAITRTLAQSHALSHSALAAQELTRERLEEMADFTRVEIVRINATVSEVVEGMHERARGWTLRWGLLWALDPMHIAQLAGLVWWVLRHTVGILVSGLVLLAGITRRHRASAASSSADLDSQPPKQTLPNLIESPPIYLPPPPYPYRMDPDPRIWRQNTTRRTRAFRIEDRLCRPRAESNSPRFGFAS